MWMFVVPTAKIFVAEVSRRSSDALVLLRKTPQSHQSRHQISS